MRTRLAIAIAGAIGLVVLARTAAYYQRQDSLALGLVATMGVAFLVGLGELFQRSTRAARLTRELSALPSPATASAVDGASAPLRTMLRARLAHAPGAASAPMAPYLVGLLVMLGLLGTFLGLFETLRGAREALTTSGDIDALRASLALPMQGLTRSFGTSAAGISTSAMLGLAATLARGSEARFARALSAYAAEALAPLTLEHRQLAMLEKLVRHGEALPLAAAALQRAVTTLASLETSWARAHAEAAERTTQALGGAVAAMRVEMTAAVERTAEAASAVFAPLMERAVASTVSVSQGHLEELRKELVADREERRAREAASEAETKRQRASSVEAEDARARQLAGHWDDATTALRDAVAAAAEALERAHAAETARDEVRARSVAHATEQMTEIARTTVDAATRRMAAAADADHARAAHLRELVQATEAQTAALVASSRAQAAAVDAMLSTAVERTAESANAVFAPLMERAVASTVAVAQKHLGELRNELGAEREERRARDAASDAEMERQRARSLEAEDARAKQLAGNWDDATTALREAVGAATHALESAHAAEAARDEARARTVAHATAQMTELARATVDAATQRMAAAAEADHARAAHFRELVQATEAQTAALVASSRAQATAVDAMLSTAAAQADSRDARASADHAALVARVEEARLAHDARAVALEERLERAHATYAADLATRLGAHADESRARTAETVDVVRDAASLVHAGGAELTAVAQMFASAVDRHREAATEWLESLGTIEAAVEQAGESIAARGLGEQLDRARELFDVQLQFHRELLVQLRTGVPIEATLPVEGRSLEAERRASDAPT